MGPFDSGEVCSMGPHFVCGITIGINWGQNQGPILGALGKPLDTDVSGFIAWGFQCCVLETWLMSLGFGLLPSVCRFDGICDL